MPSASVTNIPYRAPDACSLSCGRARAVRLAARPARIRLPCSRSIARNWGNVAFRLRSLGSAV